VWMEIYFYCQSAVTIPIYFVWNQRKWIERIERKKNIERIGVLSSNYNRATTLLTKCSQITNLISIPFFLCPIYFVF
jgi:hypothetical protein